MQVSARTAFLAVAVFVPGIIEICATDWYDYKPGELLVVKAGNSPDKQFSIVSGKNKSGAFGVYLMDAQTNKLIGKLEEVATGLDTGPEAYRAHWSPDSKHVGISSRSDRHQMENVIYRIENRRAYLLDTPDLICHAAPDFCRLEKELNAGISVDDETARKVRQTGFYSEIMKWISPTRFIVREQSHWRVKERDPSTTLAQYGDVEKPGPGLDSYLVSFDAEGECELLPGDKSRVISTHRVKKSDKE
jgi:hypothetical protein